MLRPSLPVGLQIKENDSLSLPQTSNKGLRTPVNHVYTLTETFICHTIFQNRLNFLHFFASFLDVIYVCGMHVCVCPYILPVAVHDQLVRRNRQISSKCMVQVQLAVYQTGPLTSRNTTTEISQLLLQQLKLSCIVFWTGWTQ